MADISNKELRQKIKEILKGADLTTLSAKKVRIKLQDNLGINLSDRKKEIDQMTMALIMELDEKQESDNDEADLDSGEPDKNGNEKSDGEKSDEVEEEEEPPKKKPKSSSSSKPKKKDESAKKHKKSKKEKVIEELDDLPECDDLNVYDEEQKTLKISDEELAKRLQSFEETGRRTRTRAAAPKKKERKKMEKGTSAYSRPCFLSPELAEIMGTDKLARNEVVKKMWEIVRERKLEDPKDRRFMLCDDQLLKVFGKKRVQTFAMMKYLTSHIRDEGPSLESVINNSDIYDDEAADD